MTEKDWHDKSILVVEDVDSNYQLLNEILLPTKARLTRAFNGREAIGIFESRGNFDLILLDIKMPIMDGLETAAYIRQIDKKIPIIAQTVYDTVENREKGAEAGFNEFISKPILPKEFLDTVAVYLDEK